MCYAVYMPRTTPTAVPASLLPAQPGSVPLPAVNKFPKDNYIGPRFTGKILPWVETFWHDYKRYPSYADFHTKFGFTHEQITVINTSKFWKICLRDRGIRLPDEDPYTFTEKQVAALSIMTNFSDKRPVDARLMDIHVTPEQFHGWMSDPAFKDAYNRRSEDAFVNFAPVATMRLGELINKGNFPAIKFYYEITGRAASPEAINLKQAMQVIIEAVQKHVKDPEVLAAIVGEVRTVRGLQGLAE